MSEKEEEFGTPEHDNRPRREGQGQRGNRSESSKEQRPNRYGVPRDGQSRPRREDRGERPQRGDRSRYGERDSSRGDRPRYGDRDSSPRNERPYRPSSDRPSYGNRGDRNARPERGTYGRGGSSASPRGERPAYGERQGRPDRSDKPRYGDRTDRPRYSDRPERGDNSRYGDRPQRSERSSYGDRKGRPERSDRSYSPGRNDRGSSQDRAGRGGPRDGRRDFDEKPRFEERELTEQELLARRLRRVRPEHIDPPIDDDVTEAMLDKGARNELKTLTKENADFVAEHLVMATRYLDTNPELAHQHVISASRRAGRIAIVRETLGITAYATGDFALALRELRTYRRISGSNEQIALMVDSERGVDRPDRALELGRSVDRTQLSEGTQVALAIAMSGARLDQDQVELALAELEIPQLDPTKAFSYSPALFRAYAEVLEELGRHQEAAEWISCADIAERALAEASDLDKDEEADVVVFEEELTDQDLNGEEDLGDVLEDDVREILAETKNLDEGK